LYYDVIVDTTRFNSHSSWCSGSLFYMINLPGMKQNTCSGPLPGDREKLAIFKLSGVLQTVFWNSGTAEKCMTLFESRAKIVSSAENWVDGGLLSFKLWTSSGVFWEGVNFQILKLSWSKTINISYNYFWQTSLIRNGTECIISFICCIQLKRVLISARHLLLFGLSQPIKNPPCCENWALSSLYMRVWAALPSLVL